MTEQEETENIPIRTEPLENAVKSFESALRSYDRFYDLDDELEQTLRSGVIQNFEFTYELTWKMMKRWLEENVSPDVADGIPRIELFRLAAENKLINDVPLWMSFHRSRNKTSHVYGEEAVKDVFKVSRNFLPVVQEFLNRIFCRNLTNYD